MADPRAATLKRVLAEALAARADKGPRDPVPADYVVDPAGCPDGYEPYDHELWAFFGIPKPPESSRSGSNGGNIFVDPRGRVCYASEEIRRGLEKIPKNTTDIILDLSRRLNRSLDHYDRDPDPTTKEIFGTVVRATMARRKFVSETLLDYVARRMGVSKAPGATDRMSIGEVLGQSIEYHRARVGESADKILERLLKIPDREFTIRIKELVEETAPGADAPAKSTLETKLQSIYLTLTRTGRGTFTAAKTSFEATLLSYTPLKGNGDEELKFKDFARGWINDNLVLRYGLAHARAAAGKRFLRGVIQETNRVLSSKD